MKTSEPNGALPPPMKTTTAAIIVTAVFAVACGVILLWDWWPRKSEPENDGENFI